MATLHINTSQIEEDKAPLFFHLEVNWLAQSESKIRTDLRPSQTTPDQTRPGTYILVSFRLC